MASCLVDDTVHQNAVAPYAMRYLVTSSDSEFDLSTVTAAAFSVRAPSGALRTWSASFDQQTSTTLRVVYPFVAGDLSDRGVYTVTPALTVPAGILYAPAKKFEVVALSEL